MISSTSTGRVGVVAIHGETIASCADSSNEPTATGETGDREDLESAAKNKTALEVKSVMEDAFDGG
jgi:hypothetical protein